jgi:hypothetical protein
MITEVANLSFSTRNPSLQPTPTCALDVENRGRLHCTKTVIALVFAIQIIMLAYEGRRDSPTWDEVGHFAAGLSHWYNGSFNLYRVNPPLVRFVACGPVALLERRVDLGGYEFSEGVGARGEFNAGATAAKDLGRRYFFDITIARWSCIPFALIGGYFCLRWARELYGYDAGLLALILWVFSPNILAHGHLITPDAGATALGVVANYTFWRWLRSPGATSTAMAGIALGLVELTKTTWIILFALWPLSWVVYRCLNRRTTRAQASVWREVGQMMIIWVLGVWIINIGYGFERSFNKLREYQFVSARFSGNSLRPNNSNDAVIGDEYFGNRFSSTSLANLRVPLPANYLVGVDIQNLDFERRMWSYLRGEWRLGGWWWYYVYALLVKEPLGTWVLGILAVGLTVCCRGYVARWQDELVLLAPAVVVLIVVSSQTGFNHHLRYVLPALPFLFIWISKVARSLTLGHRVVTMLTMAALTWSIISSLSVFPHSLSFFNELVGGPKNGHHHLANSNTDWGQDLLYLKRWLEHHPEARPLHLSYDMPLIDPKQAGIEYVQPPIGPGSERAKGRAPDEVGPHPGWYAISVNHLHGLGQEFTYFLNFEPVAMAGYSIYIYQITPREANRVRAKLGLPLVRNADTIAEKQMGGQL